MRAGDIVTTTNIQAHFGDGSIAYYKTEKGYYMVFLFLGGCPKDRVPDLPQEIVNKLNELGWFKKKQGCS